jgi:Uma2 family endonuclease
MSGGTDAHSTISGNVFAEFRAALDGRGCRPVNSDLRLRIPKKRSFVYPDAMVLCSESERLAGKNDIVEAPHLIVEVLSPSSEKFDRGAKFAMYKTLESCREYMLVSQDEPLVELFSRRPGGWFLIEARGLDASIRIEGLGCEIPLSGIYRNVALPTPPPSEE